MYMNCATIRIYPHITHIIHIVAHSYEQIVDELVDNSPDLYRVIHITMHMVLTTNVCSWHNSIAFDIQASSNCVSLVSPSNSGYNIGEVNHSGCE
jgi:hypothetical protein